MCLPGERPVASEVAELDADELGGRGNRTDWGRRSTSTWCGFFAENEAVIVREAAAKEDGCRGRA